MLGRLIRAALAALSAVIAVKVAEYLTLNIPKMGAFFIVLIAAIGATIFGVCSEEIIAFGKRRMQWLRKQLDPRSRFEGVWIIHVLDFPNRPFAYATINYNADADSYLYQGSAFNEQGMIGASWICPKIDFDLAKNEVRFITEAQLVDTESKGEIAQSFGYIQFEKKFFGRRLRFTRGKGFFVVCGTQSRKAHFILDRLDPNRVLSLIKKREVITHEDIAELVRSIAKEKNIGGLLSNAKESSPKSET